MAGKKTTEQTTTQVASSSQVSVEKTKKTKKTEAQLATPTPVSSPATSEKSKKTKKTEVSESEEKPKKVSKKKDTEMSEPVEKKKRVSKKKTEQVDMQSEPSEMPEQTEVSEQSEGSEMSEQTEQTEQTEKQRVRKVVNQESLKTDVEQLKQQVEAEIQRLRTDQKNKGVKFLKAVNKSLKCLAGDLNRVLKSKTKTVRNKNTSSGFMKPVKISSEMALFTQWDPSQLYSRVDVTKFLCNYIKTNELQNPEDRRKIICDEKLASLLKIDMDNQTPLTYPGLQQYIQQHFITDSSAVSEEEVQP